MLSSGHEILKALLSRHGDQTEIYFKYLEEKDRQILRNIPERSPNPAPRPDSVRALFRKIHYSWFLPVLQNFPSSILPFTFSFFSEEQLSGLRKRIDVPEKIPSSSPIGRFCFHQSVAEIGLDRMPPLSLLPNTGCSFLIELHKKKIVEIIHRLGLCEVANITKKIVDKNILKETESRLDSGQKKIYEAARKRQEPYPSSVRDFKKMIHTKADLLRFIEYRGIHRLAKALAGEDSYRIWYLAHILDQGRGEELLKAIRRRMPDAQTPFFIKQVLEIRDSLSEKNHS